jgi:hypothetical protein
VICGDEIVITGPARPASEREQLPRRVPVIHAFALFEAKDVDGRDKPGHDE